MSQENIETLFKNIESTGNSVNILLGTDLPQVRDAITGKTPLPENCSSKASLVEFILRGIAGRADELQELLGMLVKEVAKDEEAGKL